MDEKKRKTVLRMIPYGLYVLTAADSEGNKAAATINWAMQASFEPPLVAVGVKVDSGVHHIIKKSGKFGLNFLKKGQNDVAFAFFKPTREEDGKLNGYSFHLSGQGCPVLDVVGAFVECQLVGTVEKGDHSVFVGEVVDVELRETISGRPDEWILMLKDLGENIFYGG